MGLNQAFNQVKEFHFMFNHPVAVKPCVIEGKRAEARANWMKEEIQEFLDSNTIEGQADAMIDLMYFALGTLVEMGVEPENLFNIVQKANMSKVWEDGTVHYREDGKVIKPSTWIDPAPLIEEEINRQKNN